MPSIDSEQILRSFNTWAFKREQPSDPQLMLQVINHAIAQDAPIPLLFYWGKGPRCRIDQHDHKCLDYLDSMAQRISATYEPGAALNLIFTDTHARLNGYPEAGISNYFATVETEAHRRGYQSCRLSALIETTNAKAEDHALGDAIPEDMLEKLSASALKWYHGAGSAEQGAVIYFHMNMIEKRAVELAFPDAIFATFNSSKFRILFPRRLPIFYMYSMQRGVSVKPWFLPTEAGPCNDESCPCRSGN
jgi:L-tyrosine isonitrile synthase